MNAVGITSLIMALLVSFLVMVYVLLDGPRSDRAWTALKVLLRVPESAETTSPPVTL
ncbi:hypothetical protein [Asanoa sp. NPDC050611]|uniref:hypothetical protein n=1 Tax=Asanoa sp. NPDC050611 TaxID=3157098 RepID=UPI0033F99F8B